MIGLSNGKRVSIVIEQTNPGSYFQLQIKETDPIILVFNNHNISPTFSQKHLGVVLDFRLPFEDHINNVSAKVNKTVGLLRKRRNSLPRTTLIMMYKAFIWPHLDVLYFFIRSWKIRILKSLQLDSCQTLVILDSRYT